jgi:hypothetical protein
MPKTAALTAIFLTALVLGVLGAVLVTPRASAGKPYCPGNSCHEATTTATTTTTATATTPTTTAATTTTPLSTSNRLYWGAWVGSQFTGAEAPWDWNAVTDFESRDAGGKHASIVNWSSPFFASFCSGGACNFGTPTFDSVRSRGVIPFFSWANSGLADRDVTAGNYDAYITGWAQAAKAWGHPFFLRFSWEMNGSWFNWGVGNNGTTAAEYVAMWRHVHDIFTRVGATNASWVWCPNVDPTGTLANLAGLYPGDGYVDWTCLDGYNGNVPWTSFRDLFSATYDRVMAIAPSKPMIIGEVGSTESGGSKAQWLSDMFAALPARFPAIRGLLWFDKYESGPGGHTDWPVETSATASTAFAAGINSSRFATNSFTNLQTSPIPAP